MSRKESNNLLWKEKSPYLLQHAGNPVNWYPWGEEAFAAARRDNKPVFLSVGYSTCHWCHVMARESFEDGEIAQLLNEAFISVKVDREERPDIDRIYMAVCQSLTGAGGWPLTVFLTPERKPFFAGTYFPKETRSGQIGLKELLPKINDLWKKKGQEVFASAEKILSLLRGEEAAGPGAQPDETLLENAFRDLSRRFDAEFGGFGNAPKFPSPHQFTFLLRYWRRTKNRSALSMVEKTIEMMRRGGIYDHAGFGFHRYSTDRKWTVPHFEKMLYDQATMAIACLETFQATGRAFYADIAREIFSYVMLEMTSPEGGFYSAQDADTEGKEGKYYLWTQEEISKVLDREDAKLAAAVFNFSPEGNFKEAESIKPGGNILFMTKSLEQLAGDTGMDLDGLKKRLEQVRKRLYAARNERVRPLKDDKIMTDWNGLMIAAFARGGQVLKQDVYTEIAARAARFILEKMSAGDGKLLHRYRAGQAAIDGMLDDYAFFTWGLIELYGATFDPGHLMRALAVNTSLMRHFRDEQGGGFNYSPDFGEKLILERKEVYDGAIPSGNSVALANLLKLARLTGDAGLEAAAGRVAAAFTGQVRQFPSAYCHFLSSVDFLIGPSFEVVISGHRNAPDTAEMISALSRNYLPRSVVLMRPSKPEAPGLSEIAPFTAAMEPLDGRATAYVCTKKSCLEPTTNLGKLMELLS